MSVEQLVSWCFKPSQSQRITSGNTRLKVFISAKNPVCTHHRDWLEKWNGFLPEMEISVHNWSGMVYCWAASTSQAYWKNGCVYAKHWCVCMGVRILQLVELQTCDWKVLSSNPIRINRRIFFSRVNFLCWLVFGVCSTPMLPSGT